MEALFFREISSTLAEIQANGGYDNGGNIFIPIDRFLTSFTNYEDLKTHIRTIGQSLFQIFNNALPNLLQVVKFLFKAIGHALLLDFKEVKNNAIKVMTSLWFSMVITGVLAANMIFHTLSLLTRGVINATDNISRQFSTPSANHCH